MTTEQTRANLAKANAATAARMKARREDLTFMAETGESLTGAAARLGMRRDALERWAEKQRMFTELNALRGRDLHIPVDRTEVNRRNAEARWAS